MRGLLAPAEFSHMIKCAECGEILRMKSGCQLSEKAAQIRPAAGHLITFIEPCQTCIAAEIEPAKLLKAALAKIQA